MTARLAVLGSPIAHSQSPALHAAAYGVLGLPWRYDAVEVVDGELKGFLAGLDQAWRGLSLTMPLKREVLPLLDSRSAMVDRVGAANTVLLDTSGRHGFNTDVGGIVDAFREAGIGSLESVQLLGAGATAASVLVAAAELGATSALVSAREPERARSLEPVAAAEGIELAIRPLGIMDRSLVVPSAVISTLPGGADVDVSYPEAVRSGSVLLDVAYGHGPSRLAAAWEDAGGAVVTGLHMLLHQAIRQVRIFVTGAEDRALDHEARVIAAMRAAVGL